MSAFTCEAGAKSVALISHRIVSAAVLQSSDNIAEALAVGLSAAAPSLMILGGLLSKAFYDSTDDAGNPAKFANDDTVLFAALLVSRSVMTTGRGCDVMVSPESFSDAMADFGKLRPLVSLDTLIRPDMLEAARNPVPVDQLPANVVPFTGILSKRLPPSPDYGVTSPN